MKILELNIQGFRSLKDVIWKPGDLNIVIGPNGSGKSNLLKALEVLSTSAQGKLSDQVIREGGMESLVWDGQAVEITFDIKMAGGLDPSKQSDKVFSYILQLARLGSGSSYQIVKEILDDGNRDSNHPHARIERTRTDAWAYDDNENDRDYKEFGGSREISDVISDTESIVSLLNSPFASMDTLEVQVQRDLSKWVIYQYFQTQPDSPVRRSPIARAEKSVAPDGSNLIQVLHTLYTGSRDFKRDIDLAMRAAFSDDFEEIIFPPDADQRIQMRIRWKSLQRERGNSDLSDGTLRFLFLISILTNPNPPSLIAIDEPENGLHPSMLPIIAEYARNASIRTQVIITTHSAELLDAFSEFEPTVTVAKWADGQTQLSVLSGESLQYWLKEYTLGKLYRSGELENHS
jgi:predicted ATPase